MTVPERRPQVERHATHRPVEPGVHLAFRPSLADRPRGGQDRRPLRRARDHDLQVHDLDRRRRIGEVVEVLVAAVERRREGGGVTLAQPSFLEDDLDLV